MKEEDVYFPNITGNDELIYTTSKGGVYYEKITFEKEDIKKNAINFSAAQIFSLME